MGSQRRLDTYLFESRSAGSGRLRLQLLPDAGQETLTQCAKALFAPGAIVRTDGWNGYDKPAGAG